MLPWTDNGSFKSPKPDCPRTGFLSLIHSPKIFLWPSSIVTSRCDWQRSLVAVFLSFMLIAGLVWHCRLPFDANISFVIFPATAIQTLSPSPPQQEHWLKQQTLNQEFDRHTPRAIPQSNLNDEVFSENVLSDYHDYPTIRTSTRHSVCWQSGTHRRFDNSNPTSQSIGEFPGITVSGSDCSTCTVGDSCSFTITIRPPVRWHLNETLYTSGLPFKKELIVLMRGPALVTTYVTPDVADRRSFVVSYRPWDEGQYRYGTVVRKAPAHYIPQEESHQSDGKMVLPPW